MPSPSFWASNPMVPTWSSHFQSWWSSSPPRILESSVSLPSHRPLRQVPGTGIVEATPANAAELADFWERWFSPSKSSRCCMPAAHIQKALSEKRWTAFLCRRSDTGALVATIVRRRIQGLRVKQARWPEAGIVDFFCVHPAWRRKGVGRLLLGVLEGSQSTPRGGPPPHLILWEGLHLSIPPLSVGGLWMTRCAVRQGGNPVKGQQAAGDSWATLATGRAVTSDFHASPETTVWTFPSGTIAVWNTFHRSIPDGAHVRIVLAYSSKEAVEEYTRSEAAAGTILLADTQFPGWSLDSPFQWIAYNLLPGFIDTSFPLVCF